MRLKCISTGSKEGNCYALISKSGQTLLLDCGCTEKEIKIALDFNVRCIKGVLVTHSHADHSQAVEKLSKMGIGVFKPYEAHTPIQAASITIGEYRVNIFAINDVSKKHWCHTHSDGSECPIYGYMIHHKEMPGPLLYITDCKYVKWNFKKQKPYVLLMGVDYQEDLVDKSRSNYNHILTGHMSLETAKKFIEANKTSDLQEVIIGHMSNKNSSYETFIEELNSIVPGCVKLAHKGMDIDLDLPFT